MTEDKIKRKLSKQDWINKNSEKNKESKRNWNRKNRDKIKKYVQEFKERNPEYGVQYRFGENRKKVLERDNWQCQECGMSNEKHITLFGRALSIHHLDGEGRSCRSPNNYIKNLVTLCCRCHGKLEANFKFNERRQAKNGRRTGNCNTGCIRS